MDKFHGNDAMYVSSISLLVKDLSNMVFFYENYLGLTLVEHSTNKYAFFSINGKDIILKLFTNENVGLKANNFGLYHFALLFNTQQALADVFLNIGKFDYKFSGFSDHGVSEAIYLNDPEGNSIELYWDKPVNEWPKDSDGNMTMYTEYLNYNKYLLMANDEFSKIDSNTILGHLHLYVKDLNAANNFFVKTLGFDMLLDFGGSAHFISTNKYHHHIGYNVWLRGATYRPDNNKGMLGYTITLPQKYYAEIEEKLKHQNIEIALDENNKPTIKDVNNCVITFDINN